MVGAAENRPPVPAKSGSLNSSTGTIIFGNTANGSGPFQLAIARRPAFYEGTGHRKLSCCFFSPQAMCLARTSSQTSNVEEWLVASLSRLPDGSASIHLDRIAVFRRISRAILFYIDRFRTFLGGGFQPRRLVAGRCAACRLPSTLASSQDRNDQ